MATLGVVEAGVVVVADFSIEYMGFAGNSTSESMKLNIFE
jgi:hypothetical protein